MSSIDWPAIRQQYERGVSQRTLAKLYGVTQQGISRRARKEQWNNSIPALSVVSPSPNVVAPTTQEEASQCDDALEDVDMLGVAQKALRDLAGRLSHGGLDLKEHKLFADALSQYVKVLVSVPTEQEEESIFDLRRFLAACTQEELEVIRPIISQVQARLDEQQEKIRPFKRLG